MLRESDFKKYFEGKISAQMLIHKVLSKEIERNMPEGEYFESKQRTTKIKFDEKFHDLSDGEFILTINHVIKLCDDYLEDKMSCWSLEDISLILYACDGIVWGKNKEERRLIAETLFNLSSPEINYTLTKHYIKQLRDSLVQENEENGPGH